jgi:hypothetical protein
MNRGSASLDTQLLKILFGIRERQTGEMELNTHLNRKSGCPFSLHKLQVNPLGGFADAVDFGHKTFEHRPPHF